MILRNSKQDGNYFYVWESSLTCAFYRGSIGDMGKNGKLKLWFVSQCSFEFKELARPEAPQGYEYSWGTSNF